MRSFLLFLFPIYAFFIIQGEKNKKSLDKSKKAWYTL